jgi:hypothetical protein
MTVHLTALLPGTCEWTPEEEYDSTAWQPSCGGSLFEFTDGGPVHNHFAFCPYCGKTLVETVPEAEPEDADA